MLAIAIALKPDILLLDEPTSYPPVWETTNTVHWMKKRFSSWRKHYEIGNYQLCGLHILKNRRKELLHGLSFSDQGKGVELSTHVTLVAMLNLMVMRIVSQATVPFGKSEVESNVLEVVSTAIKANHKT
jgi:hypothetical protein